MNGKHYGDKLNRCSLDEEDKQKTHHQKTGKHIDEEGSPLPAILGDYIYGLQRWKSLLIQCIVTIRICNNKPIHLLQMKVEGPTALDSEFPLQVVETYGVGPRIFRMSTRIRWDIA
jgi:hypothetical protein